MASLSIFTLCKIKEGLTNGDLRCQPLLVNKKDKHPQAAEPNAVSLVLKNQKIEPQMNRMNADEEDENALFICVFHLRPSEFICG